MKNTIGNTHSSLKKKKPTCKADVRTPSAKWLYLINLLRCCSTYVGFILCNMCDSVRDIAVYHTT